MQSNQNGSSCFRLSVWTLEMNCSIHEGKGLSINIQLSRMFFFTYSTCLFDKRKQLSLSSCDSCIWWLLNAPKMPCLDIDIVFSDKMPFTYILDSHKINGILGKGKVDQTKSCFHLRYIRINWKVLNILDQTLTSACRILGWEPYHFVF